MSDSRPIIYAMSTCERCGQRHPHLTRADYESRLIRADYQDWVKEHGELAGHGGRITHEFSGDPISMPAHYRQSPSGIEVIQLTEHMGFCLGNVVKYVMRCDLKHDAIEDLKKARWYLDREIAKREKA